MRALRFALCVAISFLPAVAFAQIYESTHKTVQSTFLLRIQRQERGASSCAIVYPDHRAHYEMITPMGVQVYEGPLPAYSASQVDALLQPLGAIDPKAVVHKAQSTDLDLVIVNVMTQRGVLNLQFTDTSTRKPFKQAMDPAIRWLESARKGLVSMPESKKNNCVPAGDSDAAPKPEPPQLSARQVQALSRLLLVRAQTFHADEGLVKESCVAIAPDGRFHYEVRTTSDRGNVSSTKVFTSTADSREMEQLRQVLAEPALAGSTQYPDPPNGIRARNSETFELAIPRDDHLQRLRFFENSGVSQLELTPARAQVPVNTMDDKLLKPIRSWLKDSIEKRPGMTPAADAKPTRCAVPF